MKLLIILLSALISNSCSHQQPRIDALLLPPPLSVPRVTVMELQCVSDDVYTRLLLQNKLFAARISTLEDIIRSTWDK